MQTTTHITFTGTRSPISRISKAKPNHSWHNLWPQFQFGPHWERKNNLGFKCQRIMGRILALWSEGLCVKLHKTSFLSAVLSLYYINTVFFLHWDFIEQMRTALPKYAQKQIFTIFRWSNWIATVFRLLLSSYQCERNQKIMNHENHKPTR